MNKINNRVFNFSAGPSMLPLDVMEEIAAELTDYNGCGQSVMEMSHRSAEFEKIIDDAEKNLREIMKIPDNYKVIFVQGGGTCLLYTSDAADEEDSVDLGGRRIIKKKKK